MFRVVCVMAVLLLLLPVVQASYAGADVAAAFRDGRSYGLPFPFTEGADYGYASGSGGPSFYDADANNDGVVTGNELCLLHGLACAFSQEMAYNVYTSQGIMTELAGSLVGCSWGRSYETYYDGNRHGGHGFQVRCLKDENLAGSFSSGRLLSVRSLDGSVDANGDGVVTGQEACASVSQYCAFTQDVQYRAYDPPGPGDFVVQVYEPDKFTMDIGSPLKGCFGGQQSFAEKEDVLVQCVTSEGVAEAFQDGSVLESPFPYNERATDEFEAADSNGDTVTTGEEFCAERSLTCAFTQDILRNVGVNSGFFTVTSPAKGCFGGSSFEHYKAEQQRGMIVQCLPAGVKAGASSSAPSSPISAGSRVVDAAEQATIQKTFFACPTDACEMHEYCVGSDRQAVTECIAYQKTDEGCEAEVTRDVSVVVGGCKDEAVQEEKASSCDGCLAGADCLSLGIRGEHSGMPYYCAEDGQLREQKAGRSSCERDYECATNLCNDGVCVVSCSGCVDAAGNCVPVSVRTNGKYCDIELELKAQKAEKVACENNYECATNVCVDSQCISSGFIQKLMAFLGRLFS